LVHIEGPLKGEIQEFNSFEIIIGRHPDCQVQFPKDMVTLSRKHARIVREGNRFKLFDQSTNGTFINGQQVSEAYLRQGDVITFFEAGPKVGFLTQASDRPVPPPRMSPTEGPHKPISAQAPARHEHPSMADDPSPDAQKVTIPFAVQYGPTLKSFQSLPITLGKGPQCDFVVNHPTLFDQQAQIFFCRDQYWVKDLTGTNAVLINNIPISGSTALQPDIQLSLSPQGPTFRFLGGGRLVEVEASSPEAPSSAPKDWHIPSTAPSKFDAIAKKAESFYKKIFNKFV
jgi:pSer/pThr/pTyr-binding forkhead associated (FHA) protein